MKFLLQICLFFLKYLFLGNNFAKVDRQTLDLCWFYTIYLWLQSDPCLTKVFGGSTDQIKDLQNISETYLEQVRQTAVTNICIFILTFL